MSQKEVKFDRNTILLSKDVLRSDYLSVYNNKSPFNTKNIDSLAKKGTLFKNYFSSSILAASTKSLTDKPLIACV